MLATATATATATTTASSSPIAVWYLERATGVVALVLLTITVALGIANVKRFRTERIPRFVVDRVHRNAALLAVVFLCLHVLTTVLDTFVSINLLDAVVPFGSSYRPLWVGLGAASLDLMLAVVITSLLRRRIGRRIWRATHWLAYASWPIAMAHSLGSGTDAGTTWMLALSGVCIATVAIAVAIRLRRTPTTPAPRTPERRPLTATTASSPTRRRQTPATVAAATGSRR
jgi:methionine sulfoxide reductase heme-binding subunit